MSNNERYFPFNNFLIERLIKLYGTPLQIYDINSMKENAEKAGRVLTWENEEGRLAEIFDNFSRGL